MTEGPVPEFGIREEWVEFHRRHPLFAPRFPNLVRVLEAASVRAFSTAKPEDRVVFHLSNLCKEDFMEILLLAGNGYGIGAQKLLRGLYERAVTVRYIAQHPEKAQDFIEFGRINLFKLIEPIRQTHGEGVLPPKVVASVRALHHDFRRRKRVSGDLRSRLKDLWARVRGKPAPTRSTSRWTDDLSFEAAARKVGSLGRIVVYGWHLPTLQMHAALQNIIARVRETPEGGMEFDGGPTREEADEALNFATLIILDILDLQMTYFSMPGLKPHLDQVNADYMEHSPPLAL